MILNIFTLLDIMESLPTTLFMLVSCFMEHNPTKRQFIFERLRTGIYHNIELFNIEVNRISIIIPIECLIFEKKVSKIQGRLY
jgi:hypothetical protein